MRIKGIGGLYKCEKCNRVSVGHYHDEIGRGSFVTVKCDGCGKCGASDKPFVDMLYSIVGFVKIKPQGDTDAMSG